MRGTGRDTVQAELARLTCNCTGGRSLVGFLEILRALRPGGTRESFEGWAARLLPAEPWTYLPLDVLEDKGFIEHGTSLRVPWLTERGTAALAFLEGHGTDTSKWPEET